MKRGLIPFRLIFLGSLMVLALGAIVARLWYIQVARGADYTAKIQAGSQVTVRIPAVRGEILDRNGIKLVENRMSIDVDFYLPDMVRSYRDTHKSVPQTHYRGTVRNMPTDMSEADVRAIVKEAIIPTLEKLSVAKDYNAEKMQIHYRNNRLVPFNYMQDLEFETLAVLAERNLGLPGVSLTKKPVRFYKYGALAAHLLGYVGMPNDLDKLPDIRKFNFYDPDMEGKAQIELAMNEYLKGTPGVRSLQRDAKGVILDKEVEIVPPQQGANVYLTIDARIQFIAEQALRAVGRGAAVVIDPNNGDVLAMATVPSYDPNLFIPAINAKEWNSLNSDMTDPLLNRAVSSYAPGSTYKIATALAGLRAGIGNRSFNCSGGVTYGNTYMKCWIASKGGSHGSEDLESAIKNSCNAYFYQYGNAAGIEQIVAVGNMLGLGQKSGLPLSGESQGILPGPEFLAKTSPRERWSSGYTANTSIGQGMVLASPLQMAMVTAAVANGGTSYFPRLVDRVVAQDGKVVLQEPAKVRANLLTDGGMTADQIEKVRKGMWKVVNEPGGTGGRARIKGVEVAGKTGTAQNWAMRDGRRIKDNHVWFIAFAPYDKPKYAIAVLVQGAQSGGGVAAPVAAKILEDSMALDAPAPLEVEADQPPEEKKPFELVALAPAPGNFNFVESVDYGREIPAATGASDDGETSDSTAAATAQAGAAARPAAPNIRADADDRGRVKNQDRKPSGLSKFFNFFTGKDRKEKPKNSPAGRR